MYGCDDESMLDLGEVAAIEPSPEVKRRLLASSGAGRFAAFAAPIATMFEVTVDRAHELLGLTERSSSWQTKLPGVAAITFSGGPGLAGAECGFLRLAPGATFPMHAHVGEESAVVLAGRVHDVTNDRTLGPGDSWQLAAGTRHQLVGQRSSDSDDGNDSNQPCICAVCARDGIVFGARAIR
jgi:mannose-6-phosphate isomerase-like protein (cupin superfamily)